MVAKRSVLLSSVCGAGVALAVSAEQITHGLASVIGPRLQHVHVQQEVITQLVRNNDCCSGENQGNGIGKTEANR